MVGCGELEPIRNSQHRRYPVVPPVSVAHQTTSNDIANLSLARLIFTGDGYTLNGPQGIVLTSGITSGIQTYSGTATIALPIDVQANSVTFDNGSYSSQLVLNGALSGSGPIAVNTSVSLNAPNQYGGTITVKSSLSLSGTDTNLMTIIDQGSVNFIGANLPNTVVTSPINYGSLYGYGTLGKTTGYSLTPKIYNGQGGVIHTGDLSVIGGAYFTIGATSSTQLQVTGTVDLSTNPQLSLTVDPSFLATPGQSIILIDNDGTADAVVGTFSNMPEGKFLTYNYAQYQLTYKGGDGNDVALIPHPTYSTLAASLNPSVFGQAIAFTATVTGVQGTPTGAVTFKDGATTLGAPTLDATGKAIYSTSALTAGSHTITAVYAGDGANSGSLSNSLTQTVQPATTATAISTVTPTPIVGQSVKVSYSISGGHTPSGTVTISASTTEACTSTLAAGYCNLQFPSSGTRTITATYSGDANNTGSASAPVTLTVNPAATGLSVVSATPDPSLMSDTVVATIALTITAPGAGTPTGSVTVVATDSVGCTITLPAISCSLTFTQLGSKTITANYTGDANFLASSSAPLNHTVTTNTPTPDLAITITDDTDFLQGGMPAIYSITVQNIGTADAQNVTVQDLLPANLLNATWVCSPVGAGATCAAGGTGNIVDMVNLPKSTGIVYVLTATVQPLPEGPVTNTATVTKANGEANTGNNTAADTDNVGVFANGFDIP